MMSNFQFVPAAIVVAQGSTVRWINNDTLGFPHNATAQQSLTMAGLGEGSAFGTPTISSGETTELVMQTPGAYRYICTVHPQQMQGSITVVPAGS
jgi:plastocyanin